MGKHTSMMRGRPPLTKDERDLLKQIKAMSAKIQRHEETIRALCNKRNEIIEVLFVPLLQRGWFKKEIATEVGIPLSKLPSCEWDMMGAAVRNSMRSKVPVLSTRHPLTQRFIQMVRDGVEPKIICREFGISYKWFYDRRLHLWKEVVPPSVLDEPWRHFVSFSPDASERFAALNIQTVRDVVTFITKKETGFIEDKRKSVEKGWSSPTSLEHLILWRPGHQEVYELKIALARIGYVVATQKKRREKNK